MLLLSGSIESEIRINGGTGMNLIDADALIEKLDAEPEGGYYSPHDVISLLMTQPVVEERKTGKWEEKEVSSDKVIDEWQSARCSVCGKYHTTPYMYYFDNYKFCPNCGARMEDEE